MTRNAPNSRPGLRPAFTLIELIVVVSIVALLVAITAVVGAQIIAGARASKTRDALRTLDVSLSDYIAERDGNIPPATVEEPLPEDEQNDPPLLMPVADAVFDLNNTDPGPDGQATGQGRIPRRINSVGLYIRQLREVPAAEASVIALSTEFLETRPNYSPASETGVNTDGARLTENADHTGLPTVIDGWGQPVRYVHPRFDGQIGQAFDARPEGQAGQTYEVTAILPNIDESRLAITKIRRNKIVKSEYADIPLEERDSDGGICNGDRPYFYSVGPDGDPSTTEDNVYINTPVFAQPDFTNN